ncbi:MAG TPA: adenylate/guanylate cyclase domain-containing protein [Burkholderiales bacterium]|nr:adenylate/guanylate cyclase domain-containing protein [Burkholderiales bacterium]
MESSGRTLVCSVLFLDIVEYSKKPVSEQLQIKQAFNAALGRALEEVAPRDRIILDTGDGAAVTFLGDPEDALFGSISMRDAAQTLGVRMGVNLGPVRLVKDLNGQVNIIGDGINVAQRVMSFSRPGQLLVSRSFYEVVSCLSRDYASLFRHEGSRTDKHVRDHEVYSVGGTPTTRRLSDTMEQAGGSGGFRHWLRGVGPFGLRRSALVAAPVILFFTIAGGVAARALFEKPAAAPSAQVVTPAAERPAPVQKPAVVPEQPVPAPKKQAVASVDKKPEKAKAAKAAGGGPGKLELVVTPWGEVVIDGKSRGISTGMKAFDLPPGAHTIEIRNTGSPTHVQKVQLKAGETLRIRHRFK